MTREIKFRAKKVDGSEWVVGAYHKHLPYTPAPMSSGPVPEEDYEHCIIKDGFSDWNMPRGFEGFKVDPNTVGQYTGLKDKNGVEIYEGDVVRHADNVFGVSWENPKPYGFYPFCNYDWIHLAGDSSFEVIGNAYDNPNLIGDNDDESEM